MAGPTFGDGKICYLEIPALDAKRSADFYHDVFNWNIRDHGDGTLSFDDAVNEVSGMWVTGKSRILGDSLVVHIMVFDLREAITRIEKFGGEIMQIIPIDGEEKAAYFTDPAGNVFGLYQHT